MSANVTIYALQRVLFHLSENQQGKQPRYRMHNGCFQARAQARVIVKRLLREQENGTAAMWQEWKDAPQ
jgi:hypothetical protein